MTSTVFSKLKSASTKPFTRVSVLAMKAKAKVGPRLPRGSTVISGIKLSVAVVTTLGLSVPYMQGISDAASKVKEHADVSSSAIYLEPPLLIACYGTVQAMKSNRKRCKKIAALADELVGGLLVATKDVKEDDLDEMTRLTFADFEW